MLRITTVESSSAIVCLRVEGRLTGRGVEELRQSCKLHAFSKGTKLTLDLADVAFADADGIKLLNDLKNRDVAFMNLVPFLALQLHSSGRGKL